MADDAALIRPTPRFDGTSSGHFGTLCQGRFGVFASGMELAIDDGHRWMLLLC
jgi:hypothetical protein